MRPQAFDPVVSPSFRITQRDEVVTAGSCFAQHVARFLAASGFNFLVTESLNPAFDPKVGAAFNYGLFSARYGNLYTARQLRQLLERAYGLFEPIVQAWEGPEGGVVDPFRPQLQPGGFQSAEELALDRMVHLAAVREAFERMDVFVFTLGLTESWQDRRDGAVYPLAPGVAGGEFDPAIHAFHNFTVEETVADMQAAVEFIRTRNPKVRVILTVSPVPLNATAVNRHVFTSTTYSKAVLRVAAEEICQRNQGCDYFPSYEIITSPFVRGRYYASDCREIQPDGVKHVMSTFMRHYADAPGADCEPEELLPKSRQSGAEKVEKLLDILCDEEAIDNL
ncbi:GSCFA domain-containing protein [Altererythrobacter sp. B11]|uniref:GSCFA domain-containing protein n=1 Tax=Altererythrobacter sp. B11 TaxID=2060312 RepID=UPI0018D512C8|nr:GSCFA domain-containing protein [Altererythrobacter sp. B11]